MKVDDEINNIFETIVHLKTQIEEAKRVEELLKDQINEKEESCHKLEVEVVDLINKVEKSNKFLNRSQILNEISQIINQVLDTRENLHMLKKAPQRSMR